MSYNYNNNSFPGYYSDMYNNNFGTSQRNPMFQQYSPFMNYNNQSNNNFFKNSEGFLGYFVDSYEQVRQASVAADGTPSIFISNIEDRFWLKKTNTENGRTIVKTFVFKEDTEEQNKVNTTLMESNNNSQSQAQPQANTNFITREEMSSIFSPMIQEINNLKNQLESMNNNLNNTNTNNLSQYKEESLFKGDKL